MIGDRSYDVEAAHANAIPAIGVTWGIGDRAELEAAGAEAIVDRPDELLGLLSRSAGPPDRG
jgi:phosphoglycolate phosphatase